MQKPNAKQNPKQNSKQKRGVFAVLVRALPLRASASVLSLLASVTNAAEPVVIPVEQVNWKVATVVNGVKRLMLVGDAMLAAPFAQRALFPAGFRGDPHTHPQDIDVLILRGKGAVQFEWAGKSMRHENLLPGSFMRIPANTPHVEWFDEETEIQINGIGPLRADPVSVTSQG